MASCWYKSFHFCTYYLAPSFPYARSRVPDGSRIWMGSDGVLWRGPAVGMLIELMPRRPETVFVIWNQLVWSNLRFRFVTDIRPLKVPTVCHKNTQEQQGNGLWKTGQISYVSCLCSFTYIELNSGRKKSVLLKCIFVSVRRCAIDWSSETWGNDQ
jgi:hypothetical protein